MNPLVWCVAGAVAGWIAGGMMPAPGLARRVENVLVGVFGAFIGGEFLASFVDGAPGFRVSSLALAVGGAAVMLVMLALMRRAVGPLQSRKARKGRP